MRLLYVVESISLSCGGLGLAALRHAESVAKAGAEVVLFVAERSDQELDYDSVEGRFSIASGTGGRGKFFGLLRCVRGSDFSLIHVHGVWSPILFFASLLGFFLRIPVVISPHGSLEPWALQFKSLKKRVALALYQRWALLHADMVFVTAEQERDSVRLVGVEKFITLLPNGVDSHSLVDDAPSRDTKTLLFLSRVHPKKGLRDLVLAWKRVRRPGWRVVIAGPDELGYTNDLKTLIHELGLEKDFDFPGLVVGENKESYFSMADIFILPTYSENFGIAIAEALMRGIPVITTTGAPWGELVSSGCGWWVSPGVDGISEALLTAMSMETSELRAMGVKGRRLVIEKYSWDHVGEATLAAYSWLLHGGPRPEFVSDVRARK